jgi:hypothetical protein
MTSSERILGALKTGKVDHTPWSPFLAYWWEQCKDDSIKSRGQAGFLRSIGADPLLRGFCSMFNVRYGVTKVDEVVKGTKKQIRYATPRGTLCAGYEYSAQGDTWFIRDYPVKNAGDFEILCFIAEDTIIEANYAAWENEKEISQNAFCLPQLSPYGKSSFQSMIEYWVGTEELSLLEADSPEAVQEALDAMGKKTREAARISAGSPAEAFISWEDTSTTNISPAWYERYILPEINAWCDTLHAAGKLYVQHACGHLRHLAPLIASSGIDAIESLSDPPTGNISVEDFSALIPERIAIIGGLEPTFFMNSTLPELQKRVEFLLSFFKGKRFILANADSCPPSVGAEKFGFVAALVV